MGLFDHATFANSKWKPPGDQDRVSVVGKTGSGKTAMGLWLLKVSEIYKRMPFILIDYKGDDHISAINALPLTPKSPIPKEPGLYKLHADPFLTTDDPVDGFLRRVWHAGHCGLFFDEVYMLPDRYGRTESGTLRALYTTGRSRHIPIIALSQRPVDVTRYNFSEASQHYIFRLNDKRDRDTVRQYVPQDVFDGCFGGQSVLGKYKSLLYDVDQDRCFSMMAAPHPRETVAALSKGAEKENWR